MVKRHLTRASQLAIDLAALALAFGAAFLLRFDWAPPPEMVGRLFLLGPYVIGFEYVVLLGLGVTRLSWRYVGMREVALIFGATALANAALLLARIVVGEVQQGDPFYRHSVIPFGVLAANFVLMFLAVTGVRVSRRLVGEKAEERRRTRGEPVVRKVPTMLVGAGQAGVLVADEITRRPDLGIQPIGFLDDDPVKHGTVIHGIRVLGPTSELAELCREHRAEQVLITMASAPGQEIRRIKRLCEEVDLPTKIVPGLYELMGGSVNLTRIRDVAIDDLLRREPVQLEMESISANVRGRVVLVTGAGGSIGSELCRQVCCFDPARIVLVERAENNLFHIHRELAEAHPRKDIVPCLADITDPVRVSELFETHRPHVVLHAAAHKHVPMMEWNPGEAIKNNVLGTRVLADQAHASRVDAFVMISTDKAVNPTSVMGASKRVAETYVQAMASHSTTRFVTVRFGNVLGSAGSVIPIFKEQIAKAGPVTVTHPDMRRYFMTIPEACQLVLQAGAMGCGGEIFILDMGQPVRIVDLARDLIRLSGLREGSDIEIVFSGIRPGEKLFEELGTDAEHADKTRHPKIFVGRTQPAPLPVVVANIRLLQAAVSAGDDRIVATLRGVVPEYTGESTTLPSSRPSSVASAPGAVLQALQVPGGAE